MSPEEQLSEKIDNYLNGMLSKEETASFERDLENDPELKAEVEQRRLAMSAVDDLIAFDLRTQMNQWKEEDAAVSSIKSSEPPQTNNTFWWLLIGLLVALGLYLINRTNKIASEKRKEKQINAFPVDTNTSAIPPIIEPTILEPEEEVPVAEKPSDTNPQSSDLSYLALADVRYNPLENELNLKSPSSPLDSTLQSGLEAFKKEDYAEAIRNFTIIAETNTKAKEYLAHSHFKDGKYQEAITIFENILRTKPQPRQNLKERIEWYLLLNYLTNHIEYKVKIEDSLQEMIEPENYHSYRKDAIQLKLELDKK